MAVKVNTIRCPDCGANLMIEDGREKLFCSYCGVQIVVTNENEYIHRHIDVAKIKETEMNQAVELKKLEIVERKRAANEKIKKIKIMISVIMGVIGIILMLADVGMAGLVGLLVLEGVMFIWILSDNDKDDDIDFGDKVKVPSGVNNYESKSYIAIEEMLKSAGFTNIKCVPLNDLTTGFLKKPDTVESITINGKEITCGGKKFLSDANVVVSYHSFIGRNF